MINFLLGCGVTAIAAGLIYVVIISGLYDFLRGDW